MAGWSSRNKYSLLGAMRAVAQMISYEVILLLSTVSIVMITGSLSLTKIVEAQNQVQRHFHLIGTSSRRGGWPVLSFSRLPPRPKPIALPLIFPKANRNLSPATTEYSGFKFALFFLGEYLAMFSLSGLGATLFLGGWSAPLSIFNFVPSWFWFFSKVMCAIFIFIWIRGTLPRLRQDQLMNFAWKFVLPFTLLNLLVTALWRFMGVGWQRWVVCTVILVAAYVVMGRLKMRSQHFGRRSYSYAE